MKKILISHSWTKPEAHAEITGLLQRRNYEFMDRSVLPSEPLTARSESDLKRQLSSRISEVSTVLIASTEDAHRKPLVQYEIEECVRQGKRLIAVQPLGLAGNPVPKIVDNHANAIVGFRSEQIIAAIEGEDIRNQSSYVIAEQDDIDHRLHVIVQCASVAAIVGVLTHKQWLPEARAFLEKRGYVFRQSAPLPPNDQILEHMVLWGAIGLLVGAILGGRWAATMALGAGAVAGTNIMTAGMTIQKRDDHFVQSNWPYPPLLNH
jgi:hypothetical protein